MPCDHELAGALKSDERVRIADLFIGLARIQMALFLLHVSPDLIKLQIVYSHVMDSLAENPLAVLPCEFQQIEDSPFLYAAQARCTAHGIAFYEAVQDHFYFIRSQSHVSVKWLLLWCGNTLSALLAFEPLNLVPSVKTSFHHLDIAIGDVTWALLSSDKRTEMTVDVETLSLAKARG